MSDQNLSDRSLSGRGLSARLLKICTAVFAALTIAHARPAPAQDYPARPLALVVAFAAGGVADSIGRLVGQKLSEKLGQSVVVENRGGAGGNIAAKQVASAAPDGYTILATTTALAINETLHKNKGFATSDLTTVAIVASSPEAFAVNSSHPAKSLKEFLAGARGKTINFGSAGVGSGSHIAAEYFFKEIAKVPTTHVPFQGGAPAINAAVGNHIDMLSITLGGGLVAQVKSGALRALAVANETRVAVIGEVPTLAESGYPNFHAASWVGFFVPSKTPNSVTAMLNAAIDDIMKQPDVQQRLATLGFDPVTGSQADADRRFKRDIAEWAKRVNALGMNVE
jgi:tripartite-type tricarboxylate transporter receptor subunit TctC